MDTDTEIVIGDTISLFTKNGIFFDTYNNFPTMSQLMEYSKGLLLPKYHSYLQRIFSYVLHKLNNRRFKNIIDSFEWTNAQYQREFLSLIDKFNSTNQRIRVQLVTPSGVVYADNKYDKDATLSEPNAFNNPDFIRALLFGFGAVRRCENNKDDVLFFTIAIHNSSGTPICVRIKYTIPN
jgi:hypothetical protein